MTSINESDLGQRLRIERRRNKLTQSAVASLLGVTPSFVSKLENGAIIPSERVAARCKELFGIDPDEASTPTDNGRLMNVVSARPVQDQLGFDFIQPPNWIDELLPKETKLEDGPPAIYEWDIPQTIGQLSYLTHNFYRYYGKFPPTIPRLLMRQLRPAPGTWVLDNFSGSGTTLVEAKCEGIPSIGVDISPLATLAARVKTTLVDKERIGAMLEGARATIATSAKLPDSFIPSSTDQAKWFWPENVESLARIKTVLLSFDHGPERDFLTLAFFAIIRRVSKAFDGEVRPHINQDKVRRDVFDAFEKKVRDMLDRIAHFGRESQADTPALGFTGDNRRLKELIDWDKHPVGLVISHPPYLNCFDYVPVYKLEYMWVTGFDEVAASFDYTALRRSETRCWPATDASIFEGYFDGLRQAYQQVADLTSPGTPCCVVLGDCTIKGKVVPVLDKFAGMMNSLGFSLDRILLRSTHYGTGKYAYSHRADYHGDGTVKRDGIVIFKRE